MPEEEVDTAHREALAVVVVVERGHLVWEPAPAVPPIQEGVVVAVAEADRPPAQAVPALSSSLFRGSCDGSLR